MMSSAVKTSLKSAGKGILRTDEGEKKPSSKPAFQWQWPFQWSRHAVHEKISRWLIL